MPGCTLSPCWVRRGRGHEDRGMQCPGQHGASGVLSGPEEDAGGPVQVPASPTLGIPGPPGLTPQTRVLRELGCCPCTQQASPLTWAMGTRTSDPDACSGRVQGWAPPPAVPGEGPLLLPHPSPLICSLATTSPSHHRAGGRWHRDTGEQPRGAADHGVSGPGLPAHPRELAQGRASTAAVSAHPPPWLGTRPQVGERLPGSRVTHAQRLTVGRAGRLQQA